MIEYTQRKNEMKRNVNIIVVFNQNKSKVLMCKRKKAPFKGLYNFVGGKIEPNEDHLQAAYRELAEETNISKTDIERTLSTNVDIHGEENQLAWIKLTDDFKDLNRFAGNGNIYHILKEISLMMPF